jgi:hypothetical protein
LLILKISVNEIKGKNYKLPIIIFIGIKDSNDNFFSLPNKKKIRFLRRYLIDACPVGLAAILVLMSVSTFIIDIILYIYIYIPSQLCYKIHWPSGYSFGQIYVISGHLQLSDYCKYRERKEKLCQLIWNMNSSSRQSPCISDRTPIVTIIIS